MVKDDDADLGALSITYRNWRLTALYASDTVTVGTLAIRTHWRYDGAGNRLILYTSVPEGTWIKTPGSEIMLPLTQGELCDDECRMLKEFLGYEHEMLLRMLAVNS